VGFKLEEEVALGLAYKILNNKDRERDREGVGVKGFGRRGRGAGVLEGYEM